MPSFTYSTSTVTIGYSTKKSDFDQLLNNIRHVKSGTCTFIDKKTFNSSSIFNGSVTYNSATTFNKKSTFTATAVFSTTPMMNSIKSRTSTSGISTECGYRSGTVELKRTIRTKVIRIGAWNMSGSIAKTCTHGLSSSFMNIKKVSVSIINDAQTWIQDFLGGYDEDIIRGSVKYIDQTNVYLSQNLIIPAVYGNSGWNSTSINRGFITIDYTE